MKRNTLQARLIAIALLTLGATAAQAQGWGSEIRQDRQELRSDYRELERDRADYARARAAGDVQRMRQERREIHQDMAEINLDRAELRRDLRERRQEHGRHSNPQQYQRHTGWNHDRHESWREQRNENRARTAERRTHDDWLRSAWQGNGSSNASRGGSIVTDNGLHRGWQVGRGNPQRG